MKKIIIITTLILFAGSMLFAQQGRPQENATPEQLAERTVKRLNEELKLTAKQQADLKTWYTSSFKKRQEAFEKNKNDRENRQKNMSQEREATDAQLKKTLTPEQYKKYKEYEAKRQQERKQRNGGQRFQRN